MKKITEEEAFALLEEQGWNPMPCDTPVPFYDVPVPCGYPTEIGEAMGDYGMLPGELLMAMDGFLTRAKGDSMTGAGIFDGDIVLVDKNAKVYDSDIVVAIVDGECVIKSYCTDDDGQTWLAPQNEDYDAIPLEEGQSLYICGVVTDVMRKSPRVSHRKCMEIVNKTKLKLHMPKKVTRQQVESMIGGLAKQIKAGRQWYAVFRPLVDVTFLTAKDYDEFVGMVRKVVPEHEHLPKRLELQRMAVGSFTKPVKKWREDNAPVRGTRFYNYKAIAMHTFDVLGVKM